MKTTRLLCCLLALAGPLHAQEESPAPQPTPPPGPLLNKAPDFSSWTVSIRRPKTPEAKKASPVSNGSPSGHGDNPAGPPISLIRVTLTKTGPIRREEQVDDQGHDITKWFQGAMQVTLGAGWAQPALSSAALNPMDNLLTDYSHTDFPGFEWIAAKNYLGIKKVAGHDCLIFKDKSSLISEAELKARQELALRTAGGRGKNAEKIDPDQFQRDTVACVDVETRLPVALQRVDETRTYQFLPPPTALLVLPPEAQAPLDQWNKVRAMMTRPTARPY